MIIAPPPATREHDGRVPVTVVDTKGGEDFTVEVRGSRRPLDVFHHPYAYAAVRAARE